MSFDPKWTTVRGVGNSFPARLSLAAPFLAYAIVFNEYAQDFLAGSIPILSVASRDSFVSIAYYYYFGITLFGIGSSLYYICSSRLVRNYKNFQEYYQSESQNISTPEVIEMCKTVAARNRHGSERLAPIRVLAEATGLRTHESTRIVMNLFYDYEDRRRPWAISICVALYLLSTALLLIPSILMMVRVVDTLV